LDAAFEVYSYLGPGLLESACQTCLLGELKERGILPKVKSRCRLYKRGYWLIRKVWFIPRRKFARLPCLRLCGGSNKNANLFAPPTKIWY
jgi:hypothetical protein